MATKESQTNVSSPTRSIATASIAGDDGYLFQSESNLAQAVTYAIERSAAVGASEAIAMVSELGGITLTVAGGKVESAVREGNHSLRITIYADGRTGVASTESLSRSAIERAVEQAAAIARHLEPDPDAGLADRAALAWATPDVPLFAPSGQNAEVLTEAAMAIEAAALSTATRDELRVSEAGAASQDMRFALATSQGFCRTGSSSMQQRWCQTIVKRGDDMRQGSWSSIDRRLDGLLPSADVGRIAAEKGAGHMVAALKANGIPVTYALYPDEGHGFVREPNRMSFNALVERFLARHLGGCDEAWSGGDYPSNTLQIVESGDRQVA